MLQAKIKKFIRVKTPHDAKGLANVKTRPRTATDVKARAVPPYAIREVKRDSLTKGVGDIQHITVKHSRRQCQWQYWPKAGRKDKKVKKKEGG